MQEVIWFLLPVAAASGWYLARRASHNNPASSDPVLSPDYFKGLNYLVNEEPDKAIDVFIKMLEVNTDTVETHMALGNLFRKRGEVDRAIRIHQNLIARQALTEAQRLDALYELGQDYMRAGLLDRAEDLFRELEGSSAHKSAVMPLLLDIYQQEKDWSAAIRVADKMKTIGEQPAGEVIAHLYCEQSAAAVRNNDVEAALSLLDKAEKYDRQCARVTFHRGNIAKQQGAYKAALEIYSKIEEQDIELLPEMLEAMYECHVALGSPDNMIDCLEKLVARDAGITPVLILADILQAEKGDTVAVEFIARELSRRSSVRGLSRYIELSLAASKGDVRQNLLVLKNMTEQLLEDKPIYKCHDCGFSGRIHYWQCPGCKHWASVKPIHGVEGE